MIDYVTEIAAFILARLDQDEAEYRSNFGDEALPTDPTDGEYLGPETAIRLLVAWLVDVSWPNPAPALVILARMWQTHEDFRPVWLELT